MAFAVLVVLGGLGVAAAGYYYWFQKPIEWGVGSSIADIPQDQREAFITNCIATGKSDAVLARVVRELNLQAELGAGSEEDAISILRNRFVVRELGDQIAFLLVGTRSQKKRMNEIAGRIYIYTLNLSEPEKLKTP